MMTMRLGGRYSIALVAAVLAVGAGLEGAAASRDPRAQAAPIARATDTPDESALATARRTGERVEVSAWRTETSQVFVNPDGTKTMELHAAPVRVRRGDGWVAPDPTLRRHADGTVRPDATVSPVVLSGGGSSSLLTVGTPGTSVRLGWPGRLPAPRLLGSTATYPEVLPGVDLQVRVGVDGFSHLLVVKNRAAALNPALRSLRYPVSADGLTLTVRPDGTTVAADPSGTAVFTAPSPTMWDSPPAPVSVQERTAAVERGGGPAPKHARVGVALSAEDTMVLTPDRAMLTDPAARFPLYIDPSFVGGMIRWLHVNERMGNQSGWGYDTSTGAKVGRAYGDTANLYRSMFQLSTGSGASGIGGSRIVSATFRITLDHSPSGTVKPVQLWHVRDLDPAAYLNWTTTAGHWLRHLDTVSAEAYPPPEDKSMEFAPSSGALRDVVQAVADRHATSVSLGLRAPDEGTGSEAQLQWKKFRPNTAVLAITYNTAPRAPSQVNFTRPLPCGTAAAPTPINTVQPTLAAVASDPDHDNLTTMLSIRRTADGTLAHQVAVGPTTSGSAFAWPQLPAGVLLNRVGYYFSAGSNDNIAGDGIDFGAASPNCYFMIDTDRPLVPRIASDDFPDGEPVLPARTTGIVTLLPATTDTDVAEYAYGFQQDRITQRVVAGPDGAAQVPITVWPDPATGVPSRRLYVRAIDRAGNASTTSRAWELTALDNAEPVRRVRGDVNGDGRADISAVLDHGYGRTAVWNVLAKDGGLHTGTIGWDTGENGGFALPRTRPVNGDFDGDGRTDVALFREEAGRRITLHLLRSDGVRYDAASTPVWNSGTGQWPLTTARMISGDVNGDQRTDIAVQLDNGNGTWRVLVFAGGNLGTPVTWIQTAAASGSWAQSAPVLADVDGDGRDDLVSMRTYGGCRTVTELYRSSGSAFAPTPVTLRDSGAGNYCWERSKPVVGDVDGDGKDDIVALYEYGQSDAGLWVFRSTGTALTPALWWRGPGQFDPARLALGVGDFDTDGRDDLAVVNAIDGGGREVWTLPSTGSSFGPRQLGWRETRVGATTGPKFDIEPRTYELVARHSGRCLEVAGASQADPAALRQWGCNGGLHQRFRLVQVAGTDQYMVQPGHRSGAEIDGQPRCLDVSNQGQQDGAQVVQWRCLGQASQQLTLEYLEGSSYDTVVRLRFAHSSKCGGIVAGATGDGALLEQRTCGVAASQQWILRAALNPSQLTARYRISSVNGGHVVDVTDCVNADGADTRMWYWIPTSPCQRWQIRPLGDDVYQIVDPSSGKAIDVLGCSPANLATVVLWTANESDCQRWRIEPAHGGSWSIHQMRTGKSMDVAGCSSQRGADLIIWPYWSGPCQRWRLDPM